MQLALTARNFGFRPSSLFDNFSETFALDFDLACGFALLQFDNKCDKAKSEYLVSKIAEMFSGEKGGG